MGWVEQQAVASDRSGEVEPAWRVLGAELDSVASGLDQRFVDAGHSLERAYDIVEKLIGSLESVTNALDRDAERFAMPEGRRIPPESAARAALERRWGVLFQHGALFSNLTVRENIEAPMREHTKLSVKEMEELADLKIALVGLRPDAGALKPSELSGGMRKRAALARALALDPALLFLDEPTAGLDPIGAAAFDELIKTLQRALGLTVFLITHDLDTLYAICDRVAVLADKRVLVNAPLAEVEKFDHPWVQEYFHGPRGRAAQAALAKEA